MRLPWQSKPAPVPTNPRFGDLFGYVGLPIDHPDQRLILYLCPDPDERFVTWASPGHRPGWKGVIVSGGEIDQVGYVTEPGSAWIDVHEPKRWAYFGNIADEVPE